MQVISAMAHHGYLEQPGGEAMMEYLVRQCALPSEAVRVLRRAGTPGPVPRPEPAVCSSSSLAGRELSFLGSAAGGIKLEELWLGRLMPAQCEWHRVWLAPTQLGLQRRGPNPPPGSHRSPPLRAEGPWFGLRELHSSSEPCRVELQRLPKTGWSQQASGFTWHDVLRV